MKYSFSFYPTKKSNSGGFTFLNLLYQILCYQENYLSDWEEADLILLNSHHWIKSVFKIIFLSRKGKKFILRIDGPLSIYRTTSHSHFEDLLIHSFAINISSGLIFQSHWSAEKNFEINQKLKDVPHKIIYNGSKIVSNVHQEKKREEACLFVSNSSNHYKGFNLFQDLAKITKQINELKDLKFYAAGNNKTSFKENTNIINYGNLEKKDLSNIMHRIKYYIHPSIYEACSNALIEAINFGMIPLVYDGTSNIEIVKEDNLKFNNLDQLIKNLKELRKLDDPNRFQLINFDIDKSAKNYLKFFNKISKNRQNRISIKNIIIFLFHLHLYRLSLFYQKIKSFLYYLIFAKN